MLFEFYSPEQSSDSFYLAPSFHFNPFPFFPALVFNLVLVSKFSKNSV